MKCLTFGLGILMIAGCSQKPGNTSEGILIFSSNHTLVNSHKPYPLNECPGFDSLEYHLTWVTIPENCWVGNQPADSIFVINSSIIDFKKLVRLTRIKKLKTLLNVDDDLYVKPFPPLYITEKLVLGEDADDGYYEDHSEIFGYLTIGKINYLVIRGYGACMGHSINLLSVDAQNQLVDQIMIADDHSGKYGDGPGHTLQKINDTTYYRIYEVTGCKGWNDNVKKDSLFRAFYQKDKITLCANGQFKTETIEVDSTEKFVKMVNICGPE